MRFGVLGPLEVTTADGAVVRVPEAKVRLLLAVLLAHRGRTVSADRLVDALWGDTPPARPLGALQTKVSLLRRAVGTELVTYRPAGYQVHASTDDVDAGRFTALVGRARAHDDAGARSALLREALELWRGAAFADVEDAGALAPAIRQLEELRLVTVEEWAEARLEVAGDGGGPAAYGALAGELVRWVGAEPLRERLRAAHVRALYGAGRQGDALASLADLRERLADELGVDPSPDLERLHAAVLAQDPALSGAQPRRDAEPAGNLPAPLTPLVGRATAIDDAARQLAAYRLVTLTGPGGVGKTRLGIEVAARTSTPRDGAWLVELAGLRPGADEQTVAESIAGVLQLRADAGPDPVAGLAAALRTRELLLVLDNCEHVADAAAQVVARVLDAAPAVRILATSQLPLGRPGEVVVPVAPLDPGTDAVELFLARADAAATGRELDRGIVAEICRRLDGLPLALELAATRVRALGERDLLARLDHRFELLAGQRGGPERQRTLRAMIDWSWELLTESERTVLRRLAVPADGCDLAGAEAIAAGPDVTPAAVAGLLSRLVDRSLLAVVSSPAGPRYRPLESVAAYAGEQLRAAGELGAVRQRHRDHLLAVAIRADAGLRGPDQRHWLDVLDAESASLRAALDDAVREGAAEPALRLADALGWYWFLRGRLSEGRRSAAAALAVDGAGPAGLRARVRVWAAGFAVHLGDDPAAAAHADAVLSGFDGDEAGLAWARWFLSLGLAGVGDRSVHVRRVAAALTTFRRLGDRWGTAATLSLRADLARPLGSADAGVRSAEEAATIFRELGDRWGLLRVTDTLAGHAEIRGDYDRAAALHEEGVRIATELGLATELSARLAGRGRIALLRGDLAAADELHERARVLAARHAHRRGEQFAEVGLALSARRQGRLDDAERHLRAWLDWCLDADGDLGAALILAELGFVAELRGDADAARSLHLDGLAAARSAGDPRAVALALEGLAGVHASTGDGAGAARLLGAAAAARDGAGAPLPPAERGDVDRITATAVALVGHDRFAAEFAAGPLDPAYPPVRPAAATGPGSR
ncbi:ATP-binding protein [Jiangella alkaliphila]|uniref:Predicted ATPase n=1 Tax=Jiangella alkaliphila TaxID=419479 RepID=A0A1H2IQ30_9ACTN|nr:BTAD domain-containing putative transcriptional regulator [Jiangella alkaliphila]SDU45986.1 Predicted ATPase [Jiangella alkaliphila]